MPLVLKEVQVNNPSGALIGYNNLLIGATISGDSSNPEKALTPDTWNRWRPTATTVTAKFQMASLADVDFIGIAAHNLIGETVLIQTATSIGGALTDVESISPSNSDAIMIVFESRNIIEVALTMTLSAANEIGVVSAGELLRMRRSLYGGHSPQALSQKTKYQSSISQNGQFLGRTITRQGTMGSFDWQFIEDDWYREFFQPFVLAARTVPFFIKWRPDYYSNEVAYVHTTADISPSNMGGGHRLMSVTMSVLGHSE